MKRLLRRLASAPFDGRWRPALVGSFDLGPPPAEAPAGPDRTNRPIRRRHGEPNRRIERCVLPRDTKRSIRTLSERDTSAA